MPRRNVTLLTVPTTLISDIYLHDNVGLMGSVAIPLSASSLAAGRGLNTLRAQCPVHQIFYITCRGEQAFSSSHHIPQCH